MPFEPKRLLWLVFEKVASFSGTCCCSVANAPKSVWALCVLSLSKEQKVYCFFVVIARAY